MFFQSSIDNRQSTIMKALYFDGKLTLREVPTPQHAPGEALIKVLLAGICGTDREIMKGYSGFHGIPGTSSSGGWWNVTTRSGWASAWWEKSILPAAIAHGVRRAWAGIARTGRFWGL